MRKAYSVPMKQVQIKDDFFGFYTKLVREVIIPYQWEALNDRIPDAQPSHAVKNFKIATGLETGEFNGFVFQDSDIAKWLEAVGYSLMLHPDAALEATADAMIEIIEKAQQPDGYLNTYFILNKEEKPWSNLYECHELYCAGHMIEAAIAYYKSTGKRKMLDVVCRFADLIDQLFGPGEHQRKGYPGHQEIELALMKLYHVTKENKYLNLCQFFLEERGKNPHYFVQEWETTREKRSHYTKSVSPTPDLSYNQSHLPIREQEVAVGHAVRAVYMYTAMADFAITTGDIELYAVCQKLWHDVTQKQMYITGGIGSTHHGEAFSFDYDLPNDTVYAETCASIGLITFAHRMLHADRNSVYADVMEKILYNLIPASMARDGKAFFYVNPLEVWPEASMKNPGKHHVKVERQKWFGCACCPPNLARLLSSLGEYIYSVNEDTIYAHLYIAGIVDVKMGENTVRLLQETKYPTEGSVRYRVSIESPLNYSFALRIPSWCSKYSVRVNQEFIDTENVLKDGYVFIKRVWNNGDDVQISLDMPIEVMQSNPKVRANAGKLCLQRGPLVYCLEEADNGANLTALSLCDGPYDLLYDASFFGGTYMISGKAQRILEENLGNQLYHQASKLDTAVVPFRAIPYYLWGNRGVGEMQVWTRSAGK